MRTSFITLGAICLLLSAGVCFGDGENAPKKADATANVREVPPLNIYSIGKIDLTQWKHLSDEQQKADVEGLKKFADDALAKAQANMTLLETPHFLIYYSTDAKTAQEEAGFLETTYRTLVGFFKLTPSGREKEKTQGANVWRGKALIFLFRDFSQFTKVMPSIHPQREMPYALTLNGNGSVDMAIPGVISDRDKRRVLFTMMEGFLYRYRSPKPMPDWIQDGLSFSLADTTQIYGRGVTSGVLHQPNGLLTVDGESLQYLKQHDIASILSGEDHNYRANIVADSLATFMVRANRFGYLNMINALKDGTDADEAIKKDYGADLDRVKNAYLNYLSRLR